MTTPASRVDANVASLAQEVRDHQLIDGLHTLIEKERRLAELSLLSRLSSEGLLRGPAVGGGPWGRVGGVPCGRDRKSVV